MNRFARSGLAVAPKAIALRTKVDLKTSTILVAEDNTDSREMMKVLLRSKGYGVFEAADRHPRCSQVSTHFRRNVPAQQSISRLPLLGRVHLNQKANLFRFQ